MDGVAAVPTWFIEPSPESPRAKEWAHDMRVLATTAIETARICHLGRSLVVNFGLQMIERPRHDPSSNLVQQRVELAFKRHGRCRRRLGLDKPVNEPGAPGEQARKLHDEGRKSCCQQGRAWRRMDHRGRSELGA